MVESALRDHSVSDRRGGCGHRQEMGLARVSRRVCFYKRTPAPAAAAAACWGMCICYKWKKKMGLGTLVGSEKKCVERFWNSA